MSVRFYCPSPARQGRYQLEAEEARHLSQVCRLSVGDEVELFDGEGHATPARIVETARNRIELIATGETLVEEPPAVAITLATAVPKGERFDWLVEKATELGVSRLLPIQTKRCVVEPRGSKIDRLRRSVIEASKQCGRNRLMTLDNLTPFAQIIGADPPSLRIIAHPGGKPPRDWPEIVEGRNVVLAVGPEGGFTDEEVESTTAQGWTTVSLGRHILRVETAGIAGCASILARLA